MSNRILAAVLAVGFAACGAGVPDKVEEPVGSTYTCAVDKTYPNHRPPAGCTCKPTWASAGVTICDGKCGTPDNDHTPWCYTTATCNGNAWAYCSITP